MLSGRIKQQGTSKCGRWSYQRGFQIRKKIALIRGKKKSGRINGMVVLTRWSSGGVPLQFKTHNHGFKRLISIGVTMHSKTHTSQVVNCFVDDYVQPVILFQTDWICSVALFHFICTLIAYLAYNFLLLESSMNTIK